MLIVKWDFKQMDLLVYAVKEQTYAHIFVGVSIWTY
jgi:hypothetical protein